MPKIDMNIEKADAFSKGFKSATGKEGLMSRLKNAFGGNKEENMKEALKRRMSKYD